MSSQPGAAKEAAVSAVRVFRASDAEGMRNASERGAQRADHVVSPVVAAGFQQLGEAGMGNGAAARVIYSSQNMHIAYAWFKSGFPLPLHSHDADCFYQIVAGTMRVGSEELRKGDGVLIPAGTPYTVTPGEAGVEFIEVRSTADYDTRYKGNTEKYWNKLAEIATSRQAIWADERPPFNLFDLE